MKTAQEILSIMNHATGTTQYHKFSPFPGYPVITDGVKAVSDAAGCYWLLDFIGERSKKLSPTLQVWKLLVNGDKSASVRASIDEEGVKFRTFKRMQYTDFPLPEFKLYLIDNVLLLPSEY